MSFDEEDSIDMTKSRTADNDSVKNEKKKKSILLSIFSKKGKNKRGCDGDIVNQTKIVLDLGSSYNSRKSFLEAYPTASKNFSGRHVTSPRLEGLNLSISERPGRNAFVHQVQNYRIFVATWNVGGRSPNNGLNLEDFLQVEGSSDIYVLGFQEIVPLNAGNVLVIEDNEPAAKWLALISHALNKPRDGSYGDPKVNKECKSSGGLFSQKPGVRGFSKSYRVNGALVKACNCKLESAGVRRRARKLSELIESCEHSDGSDDEDQCVPAARLDERSEEGSYCLVASKQMVGIFLAVWVRSELVRHVAHLRMASVGRGIMGCLGNKGCIAMSMSFQKTSFCFICCHLTSGEKEGNELKRNADVAEILKSAQFPRICKIPGSRMPEKILDHDRVLWLGDLNYRIALSYEEARTLLEDNDWDSLLGRDQLMMEKQAGRIFEGWNEGKIHFAPTYKYTQNSDAYAGETTKSKKKRRTPAWCDRILWYGDGIEQLQYIRGESRFSDHRPVCAIFKAQVETSGNESRFRNGFSSVISRAPMFDVLPKRHSFYEY